MDTAIIVALIAGGASVLGQYLISSNNRRKDAVEKAVKNKEIEMRLDSIENKLDIHNHYASRFEEIEKAIVAIQTEIKGLKE